MPRVLTAAPASHNTLAEAAIVALAGTFPGATTYPGNDGTNLYPGRGSSLAASTTTPRTLTEAAA